MATRFFLSFNGPWQAVVTVRPAPAYQVALTLECGHVVTRQRRPRGYTKTRCGKCLLDEQAPARSLARVIILRHPIRADIHERFIAIVRKVEAQLEADLAALRQSRTAIDGEGR